MDGRQAHTLPRSDGALEPYPHFVELGSKRPQGSHWKEKQTRGHRLAQSGEEGTLDLRVVRLSPTLGVDITEK